MSWIESHQSLLTHRKTLRAAALLTSDKYKLIGHLQALWWWALDNAEDNGDLGQMMEEEIAEACGWPIKKAKPFVAALVKVGFLDTTPDGYALHNWWKYAGKLNAKKAKDRERKAEGSTEVARKSTGIPLEIAANSQAPTHLPPPTVPTNLTHLPTGGGERAKRNIFDLYLNTFGGESLNELVAEELKDMEEEYPEDCVDHCFRRTAETTPRPKTLGYVKTMLARHKREGCDPKPKAIAHETRPSLRYQAAVP